MKQYSKKEFELILKRNGYKYIRCKGDHFIWYHTITNRHISVPKSMNICIITRLIKEYSLK